MQHHSNSSSHSGSFLPQQLNRPGGPLLESVAGRFCWYPFLSTTSGQPVFSLLPRSKLHCLDAPRGHREPTADTPVFVSAHCKRSTPPQGCRAPDPTPELAAQFRHRPCHPTRSPEAGCRPSASLEASSHVLALTSFSFLYCTPAQRRMEGKPHTLAELEAWRFTSIHTKSAPSASHWNMPSRLLPPLRRLYGENSLAEQGPLLPPLSAEPVAEERMETETCAGDVSSTALSQLPPKGLRQVKFLRAISAFALKSLPDLQSLSELVEAELTYPSHCCAFNEWKRKQRYRKHHLQGGIEEQNVLELPGDAMSLFNEIIDQYPDLEWEMGCLENTSVKCEPKQDAFNPCEDLLGFSFLRWLTWIITIFAVAGNLAVLVILLISHRKLTISRFLMCNLAFADLCMGLYLMLIAFMDHHSRHEYYNHATDWQTGPGCGVAGFLTVFSSELSVYTLTVISLERWHTITNAMRVNKRLRMHHVAAMMGTGWGFSLVVALLPLVGVSSYSKVSVCLPMDIDTLGSQLYVVVTLILNVVAFLVVCYCYICIYLSVHNPEHSTRHGDTKIAKRMAVLIFTDFLCMAPISFFAISAALYMPLITVSHSKILLILFYPINSLCNPFLYTIFTRAFRKDMYLLVTRCGFCHNNADFYRSQTHASHLTSTQKPSNSKPKLLFNGNHIKVRDCFLNKGTT
uniref:Lutropin-choriogonadotropic hormone receptor-like n=1 Tax=Gouania willdenowi TaxID=441366 RepID=A0A8C5HHN7_GOUWI